MSRWKPTASPDVVQATSAEVFQAVDSSVSRSSGATTADGAAGGAGGAGARAAGGGGVGGGAAGAVDVAGAATAATGDVPTSPGARAATSTAPMVTGRVLSRRSGIGSPGSSQRTLPRGYERDPAADHTFRRTSKGTGRSRIRRG